MIYDYAIIGAGVSGTICAYQLAKRGKRCVIFEKNPTTLEKICGGGISYKALQRLNAIGINSEPLFKKNAQLIEGHIINRVNEKTEIKTYSGGKKSLGIQRKIFDTYLLECAMLEGASIIYGENIIKVENKGNEFTVGNALARNVIWAIGARGLGGHKIDGQSIGYSAQILADSTLKSNYFYYWYYEKDNSNKYFWIFPIGEKLWNVGLWSRIPHNNLKNEYDKCLNRYFLSSLQGEWKYFRLPRAEFLGHVDQRKKNTVFENGVGDFAGKCNPINGGGIIGAIDSAIELTQAIIEMK